MTRTHLLLTSLCIGLIACGDDGASTDLDAGTPIADSGTPGTDAGPADDAGTSDSGAGPDELVASVSNAAIDSGSTDVAAPTGASLELAADFAITSPAACESCRAQIVVGFDDSPVGCLYDDTPGGGAGATGRATLTLTAPDPGDYQVRWAAFQEDDCAAAQAAYAAAAPGAENVIANLDIGSSGLGFEFSAVRVNGGRDTEDVPAGAQLTLEMDLQVHNQASCEGCRTQVVVGDGARAYGCLYDFFPNVYPGVVGTEQMTVVPLPPDATGTTYLRYRLDQQNSCDEAIAAYNAAPPPISRRIATVHVTDADEATAVIDRFRFRGSQTYEVSAGPDTTFTFDVDYRIWRSSTCVRCQYALVLGVFPRQDGVNPQCAYWGGPGDAPGVDNTNSVPLPLPSAAGAYEIRYQVAERGSCEDAVRDFYGIDPGPERTLAELTIE